MSAVVAILGGTFDPVHNAHLAIARGALEVLEASSVLWMPTGAPKYRAPPVAGADDRVAMLQLAIRGESRWRLDGRELAPGASGYSYDTIVTLRKDYPDARFVMLLGADQFAKIETWYRWRELLGLIQVAVFARAGWRPPGIAVAPEAAMHVAMPPLAISASDIRARIGRGEDVSEMLPGAVLAYIRAKGLYR